jgi:hypothetical protein
VVGGTRRLGCWQRHPPRYTKHVKVLIFELILIDFVDFPWFWICRQKYSKFLFLSFNVHRGENISKHLE